MPHSPHLGIEALHPSHLHEKKGSRYHTYPIETRYQTDLTYGRSSHRLTCQGGQDITLWNSQVVNGDTLTIKGERNTKHIESEDIDHKALSVTMRIFVEGGERGRREGGVKGGGQKQGGRGGEGRRGEERG